MITDEEFSALIAEAAESIPEPRGADAILAAARVEIDPPSIASPIAKVRRHPRGLAVSALGAVAGLAILIAVAVSSLSSPPSIAPSAGSPRALRNATATLGELWRSGDVIMLELRIQKPKSTVFEERIEEVPGPEFPSPNSRVLSPESPVPSPFSYDL